ncbi:MULTISPECIES: type IV pilus biogenesis protein PilM [Pseudomonas syringae group]|nr:MULTISPECIES: type IV pilus biogenesis protein PilM [Pseudomonas syringae group]
MVSAMIELTGGSPAIGIGSSGSLITPASGSVVVTLPAAVSK